MNDKIHHPTSVGTSTKFDQEIWNDIIDVVNDGKLNQKEVIENFILFLRRVNLSLFIARYEIFRKIVDVPGTIVDCGVFKGQSLMTWAKLVEIFCPGDTFKKVFGFDTFSGFPDLHEKDGIENIHRDKVVGGFHAKDFLPFLKKIIDINKRDSMIPRFERVQLIQGDVRQTIPKFVKEYPGVRISLLHLDMDLYEPTKTALQYLYPLVPTGGIVLLDEYAMNDFSGESLAFDEYFGDEKPQLVKFPFTPTPGGYFIKK